MSLTFKSNIDISPKLFTSKPSSSSKSSTKVLFVSSASSPIEVNFRCKKEASLRLLSSAIREQNTFQRHIFFLALHHHFTALCAWAVKIGRCLFCHCLLQIPSSFYQLCRPRWSSKKEELYNQTRQLIFCKCAWFASLLLTYSTTRRPWHGRTDLPSVVHSSSLPHQSHIQSLCSVNFSRLPNGIWHVASSNLVASSYNIFHTL